MKAWIFWAFLELQLEIQQIDEDHLLGIPETVLQQYNQVLRNRVASLKGEISAITDRLRMAMRENPRSMTPAAVERDFERHVDQIRNDVNQLREWAGALRLTAYRKAWLKDWEQQKKAEERRLRDFDGMGFFDVEFVRDRPPFFDAQPSRRGRGAGGRKGR